MSEPRKMVKRVFMMPGGAVPMTVDALRDWCVERDLDPIDVLVTGGHLRYETPQTDEELARSTAFEEARVQREAEWARVTYAKLKAQFEPPAVSS